MNQRLDKVNKVNKVNKIFPIILVITMALLVFSGVKQTLAGNTEQKTCDASEIINIRAAISSNDFSTIEHKNVGVLSEKPFSARNINSDFMVYSELPTDLIKFELTKDGFTVYKNNEKIAENLSGPFEISSQTGTPLQIAGLKRKGKQAAYRGVFQLAKVPKKLDKFYLLNILPVEEYLKGVVPNEIPVSFGMEALKAQAIAARNYVLKPRTNLNKLFDVCDSVQSQVYYGANTENLSANRAIEDTKGLVALYQGDAILALYSSTAGGYTESYENAFSEPASGKFPAKAIPYLKGKPDLPEIFRKSLNKSEYTNQIVCLSCEEEAKSFYKNTLPSFDSESPYFRWTRAWSEEELRKEISYNLNKYANSPLIYPAFPKGTDIGKIKKLEVLSRGVSGKIIEISVVAENGTWNIKKELLIRRILTNQGKSLPSANAVFENTYDEAGNLLKVDVYGGGFGHGVGMSQFGAGFMSKNGYSFDKILQHYYDGVSIGTFPILINSLLCPLKQEFYAPKGKFDLIIENYSGLENLNFSVNSHKISLDRNYLPKGKIRMPLEIFGVKGVNSIIFQPLDYASSKPVKVWTEIVRAQAPQEAQEAQ